MHRLGLLGDAEPCGAMRFYHYTFVSNISRILKSGINADAGGFVSLTTAKWLQVLHVSDMNKRTARFTVRPKWTRRIQFELIEAEFMPDEYRAPPIEVNEIEAVEIFGRFNLTNTDPLEQEMLAHLLSRTDGKSAWEATMHGEGGSGVGDYMEREAVTLLEKMGANRFFSPKT